MQDKYLITADLKLDEPNRYYALANSIFNPTFE
jgi:hypothetical protein